MNRINMQFLNATQPTVRKPNEAPTQRNKEFFENATEFERLLQEMELRYPNTEDSIKKDLILMRDLVVPMFDKQTKSWPEYTYGELFLLEDHPKRNQESTIERIIDYYNQTYHLQLTKFELYLIIDPQIVNQIFIAKDTIHKPRPIHTSKKYRINVHCYDMESAKSPSLPSGHAATAMLFGAVIYKSRKAFFQQNEEELRNLARLCLEVGFRRVVGGVHYPSDVMGSVLFVRYATKDWEVEQICDLYERYATIGFTKGIDKIWQ